MSYIDGLPTATVVGDDDLLVIDQGGSGVPGSGTTYKTPVSSVRGTGGLVPIAARTLLANPTAGGALPAPTTLGTGLSFTGTSLGLNGALPASTAITQNSSIILNSYGAGLGDGTLMLIGVGAGASLPSNAVNTVAIGLNALGVNTQANGENVAVGWGSQRSSTVGTFNTSLGLNTMGLLVTGSGNVALGTDAMRNSEGGSNISIGAHTMVDGVHNRNVGIGLNVLIGQASATPSENVAVGYNAMASLSLTSAQFNVALGSGAGFSLTSGTSNHFIGHNSGNLLTTGSSNIAIGDFVYDAATTASGNTIVGSNAGRGITTTSGTTAIGNSALQTLTVAGSTAVGGLAAKNLTTGNVTAVGQFAALNQTTGSGNVAIGLSALQGAASSTSSLNTAVGDASLSVVTSASQNVALGRNSGNKITTGGQNVIIGPNVASTTLATGTGNILVGVDNTTDTAAAGTNDTLLFKGRNPGVAWLSGTGGNTAAPTLIAGGLLGVTPTTGITAHAGGTQALATPLTTGGNLIATCATANDSVRLPVSTIPGIHIIITNNGAASAQLYGAGTDTINGVATATGVAIAPGKTWWGHAPATGTWFGGTLT